MNADALGHQFHHWGPWNMLQFFHNEWVECTHQNWDFRAQSSKSYQRWHHFPASSFSRPFQKQPHYVSFSCHSTDITLGLIIFLGWKPYAISCSCIRLSCVWWNWSIKSCGKRREGRVRPGQELVFSFTDNVIQGNREIRKCTCSQGTEHRKCCLVSP